GLHHGAGAALPHPALLHLPPLGAGQQPGGPGGDLHRALLALRHLPLAAYFLQVPVELEEAAWVDGASEWQVFTRVLLPVVAPGIMTVALVVGLWSWNEFLLAVTFLQDAALQTAPVQFFRFTGRYVTDWGTMMAAAVIVVLPVIVAFVAL